MTAYSPDAFDQAIGNPEATELLARLNYASLDDKTRSPLDLTALWGMLYRNRRRSLAIVAGTSLLGIASVLLSSPVYRAASSIEVDPQTTKVLRGDDLEPTLPSQETERFIRTQVDILNGRSLAERVARTLRPADQAQLSKAGGGLTALVRPAQKNPREILIERLQKNLDVEMLPNSRIVQISFENGDPLLATRVANAFAEQLIRANLQRRADTANYSKQFLGGQLADAKRRLEDAERAALGYARSAHLIDASAGATGSNHEQGPKSLTTANLVEINAAYAAARAARVQAEQRWNQAAGSGIMTLPEVLANPTVQQLTERKAELLAQYKEELQHRREDHPLVQQLRAKLNEISGQLSSLGSNIRGSIRNQYIVAQRQEAALQGNVGQLKAQTLEEQGRSVQYNILRREVDTSREMYDGLLQRYKEVSAAAGITNNNIAVVDRASPPQSPVFPRPLVNIGLAVILGLALAGFVTVAREMFIDSLRDPEDVERKLKARLLGVVPKLGRKESTARAFADPRSTFSEAHYSIHAALEFASKQGSAKSWLITSSKAGEGKSTTALALATAFASTGKKVLLIDGDLRRPSLHRMLQQSNEAGLAQVLTKRSSAAAAVQPTKTENLFFVGSSVCSESPAHVLGTDALKQVLAGFERTYDVVIIDGPPVMGLADAPRLAGAAGGTIFAVQAGATQGGIAKRALQRLREAEARLTGVVLTKYDMQERGYASGYDYEYSA